MTKLHSTAAEVSDQWSEVEGVTGTEWMIEALECDVDRLRDPDLIVQLCDQVVQDLGLKVLGQPLTHHFPAPGGVTSLYLLSESHLACHTYPEYRLATFNLYCCRARPAWDWQGNLKKFLGAASVETRQFARGARSTIGSLDDSPRRHR